MAAAEADSVTVTGEGAGQVPADGDNLALRAVRALRAVGRGRRGWPRRWGRVTINKRIPVAAGLAGGSADAAAALVACNELWRAGLPVRELCEVAAGVGSDVAFAVLGGTAVGRGRGEQLTPALMPAARYHWVLAFADGAPVHARGVRHAGPAAGRGRPGWQGRRARAEHGADGGAAGR